MPLLSVRLNRPARAADQPSRAAATPAAADSPPPRLLTRRSLAPRRGWRQSCGPRGAPFGGPCGTGPAAIEGGGERKMGRCGERKGERKGGGRGKEMAAEAGRWRGGGSDGAKDGMGRAGRIQGRSHILVSGACQVKPAHRLCPPHLTCPCTHVSLARNTLRAKDERTDGAVPSGGGICWLPGQGQGLSRREIRRARLGRDRTEYTDAKQLQKQKLQRYCHVHDRHGLFPA